MQLWCASRYAGEGEPSGKPEPLRVSGLRTCWPRATAVAGRRQGRTHRRQFRAINQHSHFFCIDGLALEQCCGNAVHRVLVALEDAVRRLVGLVDQAANLQIDLPRCLFGEVTVLRDLTAEEDLLFLLAEGERTETAHAVLANHAASEVGGVLNVAARAGRHLVEEDLLSHTPAVSDGEICFKIFARVVVPVAGQEDRYAKRHATRNNRDLVDGIGVRHA